MNYESLKEKNRQGNPLGMQEALLAEMVKSAITEAMGGHTQHLTHLETRLGNALDRQTWKISEDMARAVNNGVDGMERMLRIQDNALKKLRRRWFWIGASLPTVLIGMALIVVNYWL